MELRDALENYIPFNEQEARDRELLLRYLDSEERATSAPASGAKADGASGGIWGRGDPAHFTASAWIVSPDRTRVLMAYHNIFRSWSWLGGHADGERDLLAVAEKEVREESGLTEFRLAYPDIFSVEILAERGHEKRGVYVASHLHLNVTYLFEADPACPVRIKPDENSRIGWLTTDEALTLPTEEWFVERIYAKLIGKVKAGKL